MPYSMSAPPDRIKALPKHAKEIWIAAFNAAIKEYDDEGQANATAWSAVEKAGYSKGADGKWHKGGRVMDIQELWENYIKRLFEPLVERIKDVSSWDGSASRYGSTEKYCNACLINENTGDPATWTQAKCKLPVKDTDGQPVRQAIHAAAAALAGARGGVQASPDKKKSAANKLLSYYGQMDEQPPASLYKAAGKSPPARTIEYLPLQTRAFIVTRTDGIPRWLMIAASAVVNKVGAIDSTALFDNFIKHARETSEYPRLDFLHQEEAVSFGQADWLARDGALYLASGTFDDTDVARAAAAGLESDPAYWGASISYHITQPPLLMQGEGTIPVYTDGINNFISIVPRRMAANLFTAATVTEEVIRMDKSTFDELVRLVGEAAAQQFAEQVDDANRTITDTGMITRAEPESPAPTETVKATEATPEPEAKRVEIMAAVPVGPATPAITLESLAAEVAQLKEIVVKLVGMGGMIEDISKRATDEQTRSVTAIEDLNQRLKGVEASKERWDIWLADAPEHIKAEAESVFRARDQEPAPMTLAQIAEQNISKLNRGSRKGRP